MLLDERYAAEEVADEHEEADPADAANGIEHRELREVHMACTRNERGKRAEERHETRDDDCQATVLLEEIVELGHALGRERLHLARVDDATAEEPRDPVIRCVAQDGRRVEHDQRDAQIEPPPFRREHAACKQKRVARKEREEDDAGLDEHNQEQRTVDQHGPERGNPSRNLSARVLEEADDEFDEAH